MNFFRTFIKSFCCLLLFLSMNCYSVFTVVGRQNVAPIVLRNPIQQPLVLGGLYLDNDFELFDGDDWLQEPRNQTEFLQGIGEMRMWAQYNVHIIEPLIFELEQRWAQRRLVKRLVRLIASEFHQDVCSE